MPRGRRGRRGRCGRCGRRGRRGRRGNSTAAHTGGWRRCSSKRQPTRGCWLRRRLHCYTKTVSRDRGLAAEGITQIAYQNQLRMRSQI